MEIRYATFQWWIRAIPPGEFPIEVHWRINWHIKNLAMPSLVSALEGFIVGAIPRYAESAYPYFGLISDEDA